MGRKNKISRGLNKLFKSKEVQHFQKTDIFVLNPESRDNYFELYAQAQLAEVANAHFKQ